MNPNTRDSRTRSARSAEQSRPFLCSIESRPKLRAVGLGTRTVLSAAGRRAGITRLLPRISEMQGSERGDNVIPWRHQNSISVSVLQVMVCRKKTLRRCVERKTVNALFAGAPRNGYSSTIATQKVPCADCSAKRAIHSSAGTNERRKPFLGSSAISIAIECQPCHADVLLEIANR